MPIVLDNDKTLPPLYTKHVPWQPSGAVNIQ